MAIIDRKHIKKIKNDDHPYEDLAKSGYKPNILSTFYIHHGYQLFFFVQFCSVGTGGYFYFILFYFKFLSSRWIGEIVHKRNEPNLATRSDSKVDFFKNPRNSLS